MIKIIKDNFRILRKIIVLLMIILTLWFVISSKYTKTKVLVIEDYATQEKFQYSVTNCNFSLGYIHSVMKTPVEEFFYINEQNQIVLERIIYESYGVGTPFLEEEGELEVVGDTFSLKINRIFDDINMIISPIPNHWLSIGGVKYEFNDTLKPNSNIKIYVNDVYKLESFFQ